MADNWGLHSVVKGFFPLADNPTSCFNGNYSVPSCFETEKNNEPSSFVHLPDSQHKATSEYSEGLKDLFKPTFHPILFSQNVPISSPPSLLDTMQHFSPPPPPPPPPQQQEEVIVVDQPTPAPKPKKKRSQIMRRVCENVPAEGLTSDMWGWRKYGQKPIKGTPHPRSYYRCTSPNCGAKKMVEQRSSGPDKYRVIYLHDHNHAQPIRINSAAGKPRPKRAHPPAVSNANPGGPALAPPGNQGNGLFDVNYSDEVFNVLDGLDGPVAADGWMGLHAATAATSFAGM